MLLQKAFSAKNGEKFPSLYEGDASDHGGDQSRADFALCASLAFWCRKDAAQIDRLFRASGRMRPKWDERRSETTYVRFTIGNAVAAQQDCCAGSAARPAYSAAASGVNGTGAAPRAPGSPNYRPAVPYTPFPAQWLPHPWADYCAEVARVLRCDAALTALPLLSVLASAVEMTRRVALGSGWTEPCVIWTCVIAEPGGKKSPAADFAVGLVEARQQRLFADYAAEMESLYGGRRGKGDDRGDAPPRPTAERVLAVDVTIEKVATLIHENPRGFLLHRDELAGWIGSFIKYKGAAGGSDDANWLTMHRGGLLSYDRKTGSHLTVFAPNACVSVCGGVQPAVWAAQMHKGLRDSGLSPRLLVAEPPKSRKEYVRDASPRNSRPLRRSR